MRAGPLLLGGLGLALLLLAQGAQAAPPLEQAWRVDLAAYAAGTNPTAPPGTGPVLSVGFDEAGGKILLGTADTVVTGGGGGTLPSIEQPSPGVDFDLFTVLFDQGNTSHEADAAAATPEGKASVALSGDGNFAVAGGNYSGNATNGPNIYFYALPDMRSIWNRTQPEPVGGVTLSHDGRVVAVGTRATNASLGRVLRFFGHGPRVGEQMWQLTADRCPDPAQRIEPAQVTTAGVTVLDLSRDGKWLAVGTTLTTTAGDQLGCVLLFDASDAGSLDIKAAKLTPAPVTAVDMAPGGAWYAAGTRGGQFYLLDNTAARGAPLGSQLNALAPIVAVRAAPDGSAVVVADATSVNRYLQRQDVLQLDWVAPVTGLRSLDATADGEYIVVGAAELTAFHRTSNQSLWSVPVPGALVKAALNGTEVRVVAVDGTVVRGFRLHYLFEVHKTEPEPLQLIPGQPRPIVVGILNNGSGVDTFELGASAQGFVVDLDPPQLLLRPGELGNATVTVTPQPEAQAGLYRVAVQVHGQRSGSVGEVTVNATVGALPALVLRLADPNQADFALFQGDQVDVLLQAENTGNSRLELAFDLTQDPNVGDPWQASLSRTSGSVEPRGVSTVTLHVAAPVEARNGTSNVFTVTARGEGVQAALPVRVVVNPIFTGSIEVVPLSKVVTPGKSVSYTVVVANNGTLRETYRLAYCVARLREEAPLIPCLGNATQGLGGWSVALDTSPFVLDHNESRPFSMSVAAPRGTIPGDRLALQVEVISATPQHPFRDVDVVITSVVEEVPPERPPRVPGPDALLAVGAALAAVLVARQRRA